MRRLSSPPVRAKRAPVQSAVNRIRSLSIIGGFLDGTTVEFAEGLNCLIGARGTGKTTILELVRFALDELPDMETDPAGHRRIEALVENNLDSGRVQVSIETKDGLSYIVSRSAGEEPIVLTADGQPTDVTFKCGSVFKADIYSQNEVENIADRALSQLVLIDNFEAEPIAEIELKIKAVEAKLTASAGAIRPLQDQIAAVSEEISTLPGVEEKLKGYAAVGGESAAAINQAHAHKALRDRERRAVEGMGQFLTEYTEQVRSLAGQAENQTQALFTRDILVGPNGPALTAIRQNMVETATQVNALLREVWETIERVQAKLEDAATSLTGIHNQQELAFRSVIEKHQAVQGQALERSRLEKLRNDLLAKQRTRDEAKVKLARQQRDREQLLRQLSELRNQRFSIRHSVAERINTTLAPTIRVSIVESGNFDTYRGLLEEALRGRGIKQNQVAQKLVGAFWPADLSTVVQNADVKTLMDQAELNEDQAKRVVETLADTRVLFRLETVELLDLPRIELKDGDIYKDSTAISKGQKCTTILPILLLDSNNPLLVDQPEDNLDNRFIFECVVGSILNVKPRRQLIFVTHNPNIPVLGDAERVFVLESDGSSGRKVNEGTVDECKDDIVTLLEGGKEAFEQRQQRYAH